MQLFWPERRLVRLTVALANTARERKTKTKPKTKRQKREAKVKPSQTWADMMAFSNSIIGPLGIPGFVGDLTDRQAREVESWLAAVADGDLGNLPDVLAQYIASIVLKPVLAFENRRLLLLPTTFRASPIQLAALGTAFLMDPEREWHSRFGKCASCGKFFVDMRKGRGPKRRRWCPGSNKCKDAAKYMNRKTKSAATVRVSLKDKAQGATSVSS
jgi:hypothetical protein